MGIALILGGKGGKLGEGEKPSTPPAAPDEDSGSVIKALAAVFDGDKAKAKAIKMAIEMCVEKYMSEEDKDDEE